VFKKIKQIEFSKFAPLLVTLSFVIILIQYSFYPLESIFYDFWIKNDVTSKGFKNPVVIITLDSDSDQFLGETYPYTYASHERFIARLVKDGPAIINYFVSLLEPDSEVEARYQSEFKEHLNNFQKKYGERFRFATEMDSFGEQIPPEALQEYGYNLAQIYKDQIIFSKDDVVRRVILNISGEDSLHLWTAKKYRKLIGLPELDATAYKGAYYNSEADANFALFKYAGKPSSENPQIIPFHRVLVGNFPPGYFKDKIVLIGPKYDSSSQNDVATPFQKDSIKTAQMIVHAHIIEALINERTLTDVRDLSTQFTALILALILSFIISRVQPVKGLIITIFMIFGILLIAYVCFMFGWWFKLSHLILSIFVVYYIWVPFRAIEEYQTRYAIQEEAKLLKQVDNLKQNFISLMSHDLKTPVAKIAGIADILKIKFKNTNEQEELINNIVGSTKELNNFINSILDLTKIESQNLTLKKESKDINKIIETIVDKLQFEANEKHMKIELELSPLYPIQLDTVLMNRVISNLVENAIKYAGQGKSIWVKTWDDADWVYIEIRDDGLGIAPDDLAHIFDKFYRVKNDSTHAIKGSGLGLYLVKYFIELHNGVITATSQLGQGTSFIIKLKNE